jgi:hypothetical protein
LFRLCRYSLSQASLEQVFLKFCALQDEAEDDEEEGDEDNAGEENKSNNLEQDRKEEVELVIDPAVEEEKDGQAASQAASSQVHPASTAAGGTAGRINGPAVIQGSDGLLYDVC